MASQEHFRMNRATIQVRHNCANVNMRNLLNNFTISFNVVVSTFEAAVRSSKLIAQ